MDAADETTAHQLQDGEVEDRVQVDRRTLENMLTGDPTVASAFFDSVGLSSGARVLWPSRLKIGAKTKKDPFVKLLGTPDQVQYAKKLIQTALRVKRVSRCSLRIEVWHGDHSFLIGRGGNTAQRIQAAAECHIHFPDSSNLTNADRSDQVSIAGLAEKVEEARAALRMEMPLALSIDISGSVNCEQPPPSSIVPSQLTAIVRGSQLTVRGAARHAGLMENTIMALAVFYELADVVAPRVRLNFCVRRAVLANMCHPDSIRRIESIATAYFVQVRYPTFDALSPGIELFGPLAGILVVRAFLLGLLPVSLSFETDDSELIDGWESSFISQSDQFVNVSSRVKPIAGGGKLRMWQLRSTEEWTQKLLERRAQLVGELPIDDTNPSELLFLQNPLLSPLAAALPTADVTIFDQSQASSSGGVPQDPVDSDERDDQIVQPPTPDPADSPIAHSILAGAKKRLCADRAQLLLKASKAAYATSPLDEHTPRFATDLWSGLGFSSSLPAELLKGVFEQQHLDARKAKAKMSSPPPPPPPPPPPQPQNQPTQQLFAVAEEDEAGDLFVASLASSFAALSQQNTHLHALHPSMMTASRPFAASTSVWEASSSAKAGPKLGTTDWDIRVFSEPALVLAHLGCQDYVPCFRDHEIDMQSFLLLDEAALKDIGVATIGARKKLHYAILKLRESAQQHGYAI